jgi:hypothetical protein
MDMPEPAGLRQRFVFVTVPDRCSPGTSESGQGMRAPQCGDRRTVPDSAVRWISKAQIPLQQGRGGNELPERKAGNPLRVMTQRLRRGIVLASSICSSCSPTGSASLFSART